MHHSEVMKDMFQIPQPAYSAADLIEGCPIVHMSDTASDIELFLLALYDGGSKYVNISCHCISFPTLWLDISIQQSRLTFRS